MSRTLSNGVLGLRFMQNAQRAKQLKEVELQRAEIVDEGRWEVSQAVREAWGLTKGRNEDQDTDIHEASYVPFLYSNADEDNSEDRSQITSGRRVFKPTNLDVPDYQGEPTQGKDVPSTSTSSKPPKGRIHAHPRPISISNLGKGKSTPLKGFDQLSGSGPDNADMKLKLRKPKGKEVQTPLSTARELIFESGNVGVDLRDQASSRATPRAFMKPAGVDDPKELAEAGSSAANAGSEVGGQIIDGARLKSSKIKREREDAVDDEEEEEVKKKRKKKRKRDSESRG